MSVQVSTKSWYLAGGFKILVLVLRTFREAAAIYDNEGCSVSMVSGWLGICCAVVAAKTLIVHKT